MGFDRISPVQGRHAECGFSLVELIIALAVGMVILAAMYSVFTLQSRYLKIEEQVAEMQQSVRAGMDMMVREIRMAGYDPSRTLGADIITVQTDLIEFSYAVDGTLRTIAFDVADSVGKPSLRLAVNGGSPQPVVQNIDDLVFVHASGPPETVTITLTGRTDQPDPRYTHPVHNDHYRRYTLETTVVCRNLNL